MSGKRLYVVSCYGVGKTMNLCSLFCSPKNRSKVYLRQRKSSLISRVWRLIVVLFNHLSQSPTPLQNINKFIAM